MKKIIRQPWERAFAFSHSVLRECLEARLCEFCGASLQLPPLRRFASYGRGRLYEGLAERPSACENELEGRLSLLICRRCRQNLALSPHPLLVFDSLRHRISPLSPSLPYADFRRSGCRLLYAPLLYEAELRQAILKLKFASARAVAEALALLALLLLPRDFPPVDAVVPLPLSRGRARERGYNQAALIGRFMAKELSLPCLEHFLVRTGFQARQTEMEGRARRLLNVRQVYCLKSEERSERWRGKTVLLLDDVITSGASLAEAARVLEEAGMVPVLCALAREMEMSR